MARPLRIQFPGALYHVVSRGNGRQAIFLDAADRRRFLALLAEAVERHNLICHAYCLMDNHFHLLIETPEGNLARAMAWLNATFSQWWNKKHQRAGHVLQGRYWASLVQKDAYLLAAARYIELNPVRAGLVNDPARWRWSSHRAHVGLIEVPAMLATDFILRYFHHEDRPAARKRYRAFVLQGVGDTSERSRFSRPVVGSDEFVASVSGDRERQSLSREIPKRNRLVGRPALDVVIGSPTDRLERTARVREAHFRFGYTMLEIARYLHVHYATVSRMLREACGREQLAR